MLRCLATRKICTPKNVTYNGIKSMQGRILSINDVSYQAEGHPTIIDFNSCDSLISMIVPSDLLLPGNDSNATHKKHVQEEAEYYEGLNVLFRIIPPNMTSMLHPNGRRYRSKLSTSLWRQVQCLYGTRNQSKDASLQTAAGNIKIPKDTDISTWITVSNAFKLCGFVDRTSFKVENLHKQSRNCFGDNFSLAQWKAEHAAALREPSRKF